MPSSSQHQHAINEALKVVAEARVHLRELHAELGSLDRALQHCLGALDQTRYGDVPVLDTSRHLICWQDRTACLKPGRQFDQGRRAVDRIRRHLFGAGSI